MWRVKKLFFRIEEVREIILEISKGKAQILGMYAKTMLGTNSCEFAKLGDCSKSLTKNAAGVA